MDPDKSAPYDLPNCSKDYLAGNAPEEWLPLRTPSTIATKALPDWRAGGRPSCDSSQREVLLDDGKTVPFRRSCSPPERPRSVSAGPSGRRAVHYLRTLADSRAIIAAADRAKRAVVLGASSSASRWPPRSVLGDSRSTSWPPTLIRLDVCSVRGWVVSFGEYTKSMAWCSISSGKRAR